MDVVQHTNNVRNPNNPPIPVRFGLQTTNEMAEMTLQAVVRTPQERQMLVNDYAKYFFDISLQYYQFCVRVDPNDEPALVKLGRALAYKGEDKEALTRLRRAIELQPNDDRAHYELGFLFLRHGMLGPAYTEMQNVIRLNPDDYQAFGSLGYICLTAGRYAESRSYLETALRLNPDDAISRGNLARLEKAASQPVTNAPSKGPTSH